MAKTAEEKQAAKRSYYEKHRKQILEKTAEWAKNHVEERRGYARKYRELHSDEIREAQRRYRKTHPDAERKKNRKYREAYPDRVHKSTRKWKENNPKKARISEIKSKYGVTTEEAMQLLSNKENRVCAICGSVRGRKELGIDHNHITGKIRGLLCLKCNTAIGNMGMEDNPELLRKAADYLEQNSQ